MATGDSGEQASGARRATLFAASGLSVGLIGGTILWLLTGKLVWLILGFCFSPLLGVAIWRGGDRGRPDFEAGVNKGD